MPIEHTQGTSNKAGGQETSANQHLKQHRTGSQSVIPHSNGGGNDKNTYYSSYLLNLQNSGKSLRSDQDQPCISNKPLWFDEELFKHAKSVYERHFMGINFAHLSGLLLLVRVDTICDTLSKTGESEAVFKLFKRYYNTVKHVKNWYEGDIFEEKSDAYKSLLIVRGMHNKVCSRLNFEQEVRDSTKIAMPNKPEEGKKDSSQLNKADDRQKFIGLCAKVHISEYDIMLTQFAFVGFIVLHADKMGLVGDFNQKDLDSLLHFWRVIGYYLGASENLNLFSRQYDEIVGLCNAIKENIYKNSLIENPLVSPQGVMSVNIIRSIKFIPMLTVYGMMRHLYDILGHDTQEIELRRTWYSNLSYTLINLVMTRLLRYKAFRSFNNSLTRLSLYLVGHFDGWYSKHLEYKYGRELKI